MSLSHRDTLSTFHGRSSSASLSARSAPERRNAGSTSQIQPGRVRAMRHSLPDEDFGPSAPPKHATTKTIGLQDMESLKDENMALKKRVVELEDERMKIKTRLTVCSQRLQDKDDENQSLLEQVQLLASGDAQGQSNAKSASAKSVELVKKLKTKVKILETNLAEADVKLQKSYNTEYSLRHEELEVMNKSYQNEIRRLQALIDSRYVEHTRGKLLELESDNALLSRELFDLVTQKKETDAKVVDSGKKVEHLQDAMDLLERKMKEDADAYENKYQKALSALLQENMAIKELLMSKKQSIQETMSTQWHQIQSITSKLTEYFNRELEVTKVYYQYKIDELTADFLKKLKDKEDEKMRLLEEIKSRDATIEGLNQTIKGLQSSIEMLNSTATQLQKSIDKANETIGELNSANKQLHENLQSKEQKIDELKNEIEVKKDDIHKLKHSEDKLKLDINDLNQQLQRTKNSLEDTEGKLENATKTIATRDEEIGKIRTLLDDTKAHLHGSLAAHAETKKELDFSRIELEKRQDTITALTVEKNEYSDKLADMKNKLEEFESSQQKLTVDNENLKKQNAELNGQLQEAHSQVTTLNHRIESFKKDTVQLQSHVNQKVDELTRVQDYLEYAQSLKGDDDVRSVMSYQNYHKSKTKGQFSTNLRFDFQASSVHSGVTPVGDGESEDSSSEGSSEETSSQTSKKSRNPPESTITGLEVNVDGKLQDAYNQHQSKHPVTELPGESIEFPKRIHETETAVQIEERVELELEAAKKLLDGDHYSHCVTKLEALISTVDVATIKAIQRHSIYSTLSLSYRHLLNFQKSIEILKKSIVITKGVDAPIEELESARVTIEKEFGKNQLDDLVELAQTLILQDEAEAEKFIKKWVMFFKGSDIERLRAKAKELSDLPLKKLHMSCRLRLTNYCKKLLGTCNPNELDKFGYTALHEAVQANSKECVELLLNSHADPGIASNISKQSQTCLFLVQEVDILELLLDKGANPAVSDDNGNTPLHLSAGKGYNEVSRKLIDSGAPIVNRNKKGRTALHNACEHGHEPIASLLIEKGAELDMTDDDGNTALMLAAENENEDVVSLLLEHNANLVGQNKEGNTALHIAAKNSSSEIVEMLLDSKDVAQFINLVDSKKQSALHIAMSQGDEDIAVMLAQKGADLDLLDENRKKPYELTDDDDLIEAVKEAAPNPDS